MRLAQAFGGRSNRRQYWLETVVLAAVGFTLASAPLSGRLAITGFWFLIYVRRLHDFGRSGWWALIVPAAGAVALAVGFALAGADLLDAMIAFERGVPGDARAAPTFGFVLASIVVVQLAFTLWLGVARGDPGANRYGPPPRGGRRAVAAA